MLRASLSALFAFLIFLTIHAIDFHFFYPEARTHHLLWSAGLGLVCFIGLICILPKEEWFQSKLHLNQKTMVRWVYPGLGILFYGFLFLGYLEFYFTAERSITFRMLMLIDKQPGHAITNAQMFEYYDVTGIINKRLDDLIYGGYLTSHDNKYFLTNKGFRTLAIYRHAIEFLRFNSGQKEPGGD